MFRLKILSKVSKVCRVATKISTSRHISVTPSLSQSQIPIDHTVTSVESSLGITSDAIINSDNPCHHTDDRENLHDEAFEAAIKFVPIHGWSREALEAGCIAEQLPLGIHSVLMPNNCGIDLVTYFYESRNQMLAAEMAEWRKQEKDTSISNIVKGLGLDLPPPFLSKSKADAFLHRAIKHRLCEIEPVLPYWPQAMGLLALPKNVPAMIGLEAQLVDLIWAYAGDRSVDLTWYAKRMGLAYVYKLTELYFIQDTSPEHEETWKFLDRRISDLRAMKKAELKGVANMLREGIFAAGHVTSHILGWNFKS